MRRTALLSACILIGTAAVAQEKAPLPPLPAPQTVPRPGPDTGRPDAPQAILPGGIVMPLFAPDSPYLKADKLHVPEVYKMSQAVHGRISSIVSIHNPSIEVHLVERSINTGTAVIVIAGGGHRILNVGGEAADFVPFFYNYRINTVILRNRLRADGSFAELAAPAAVLYEDWDRRNSALSDPFAGISSRPDFVGIIYPGPTPFVRNRTAPPIP